MKKLKSRGGKKFKDKHSLPIRKPEPAFTCRATAFCKHNVKEYFNNLGTDIAKYQFVSDRISNLNETGATTVQNPKMIVAATEKICGFHHIWRKRRTCYGCLCTVCCRLCFGSNANLFTYKLLRSLYSWWSSWMYWKATRTVWINVDLFVYFLEHISELTGCTTE